MWTRVVAINPRPTLLVRARRPYCLLSQYLPLDWGSVWRCCLRSAPMMDTIYIMYAEIFRPFETNVHNIFFLLVVGRSPTSATLQSWHLQCFRVQRYFPYPKKECDTWSGSRWTKFLKLVFLDTLNKYRYSLLPFIYYVILRVLLWNLNFFINYESLWLFSSS
jgi:hypothetical protein